MKWSRKENSTTSVCLKLGQSPYAARTRYETFFFIVIRSCPILTVYARGFLLCELGYDCHRGGD